MAQLVIAAAGAAVGSFFGQPALGWGIGSALGGALFAKDLPAQHIEGSSLSDLKVTGTEYGQPIPFIIGHPRVPGQVWWASDRRKISTTSSQTTGGKGGGGSQTTTTTSYTNDVDIFYGLSDNIIAGVRKIWWNGELVFNVSSAASADTIAASLASDKWTRMTVYTGAADQLPDPTYEAAVGTANAVAHRGRGGIFFESLHLGPSGQIPQLTFELANDDLNIIGDGTVIGDNYAGIGIDSTDEGAIATSWTQSTVFDRALSDIVCFSHNYTHSVWIDTVGRLWGIGDNRAGQLCQFDGTYDHAGSPNPMYVLSPVQIAPGNDWVKCYASRYLTFAINSAGQMFAAGTDGYGQTGTSPGSTILMANPGSDGGTIIRYQKTWTQEAGVTDDWDDVTSGMYLTLAVKVNGSLWRVGAPTEYNIDGTRTWTQVGTAADWLGAQFMHGPLGCAIIKADGTMWGFARSGTYWFGNGELNVDHSVPIQIGTDADWMVGGGDGAVGADGLYGGTSGGANHAIKTDGTLWACGEGATFALGTGTATDVATWTQIGTNTDWIDVKNGRGICLALKADRSVWWSGRDYNGGGPQIDTFTEQTALGINTGGIFNGSISAFSFGTPKYSAEDLTEISLSWAVTLLCRRAGLDDAQFDVSGIDSITKPVRALALTQIAPTRSTFEMLFGTYFFEATVSDKIYFRARGGASVATIQYTDLGATQGSESIEPLALKQRTDIELAAQIAGSYANVNNDYQTDTQYSDRLISAVPNTVQTMQVPMAFTPSEMKGIVNSASLDQLVALVSTRVALLGNYARLEATDVVTVTGCPDGLDKRLRFVNKTDAYPLLQFDTVLDDASVLSHSGITDAGPTPPTDVTLPADTLIELMDIPILRDVDDDTGFYAAAKGDGTPWPGGFVYGSPNDVTYAVEAAMSASALFGTCSTTLGNWTGPRVFDETSLVTVDVGAGTLTSMTRDDLLGDQSINAMLIGSEIVQFRSASLVTAGVYILSGLLRGGRGTEWAMTGHAASERCVLLTIAGLKRISRANNELGIQRYYKGVTLGQVVADVTPETFTDSAIGLKPFSPFDLRATRDGSSNITFTWQRRTRLAVRTIGTLGISIPLGEASEAYDVQIYDSGSYTTLKRTITATTTTCDYSAADQTTDFGSAQATVYARVYQRSAKVGLGYKLEAAA